MGFKQYELLNLFSSKEFLFCFGTRAEALVIQISIPLKAVFVSNPSITKPQPKHGLLKKLTIVRQPDTRSTNNGQQLILLLLILNINRRGFQLYQFCGRHHFFLAAFFRIIHIK